MISARTTRIPWDMQRSGIYNIRARARVNTTIIYIFDRFFLLILIIIYLRF